MKRIVSISTILILHACSNPECGDDERKIGKTCFPKAHHDAGMNVDSGSGTNSDVSEDEWGPDGGASARGSTRLQDAGEVDGADGTAQAIDHTSAACLATEVCDGLDNDCDGIVDNHDTCVAAVTVKQISVGYEYACATLSDGTVKCWGSNKMGQLGVPASDHLAPTRVPGITTAVQVAAGYASTCALLADSTVVCWGSDQYGGLGDGGSDAGVSSARQVPGLNDIKSIHGTCAVHLGGTLSCWNSNKPPTVVPGVADVIKVAQGQFGGQCALVPAQKIQCWAGDYTQRPGGSGSDFDSDSYGACAISGGAVTCWGSYQGGLLGHMGEPDSLYIYQPKLNGPQSKVAVGGDGACAIAEDGSVNCWASCESSPDGGVDKSGQETTIAGIDDAVDISAGSIFCVQRRSGLVSCWSNQCDHPNNTAGELGDDTTVDRRGPVNVVDLP